LASPVSKWIGIEALRGLVLGTFYFGCFNANDNVTKVEPDV
jgi:hypothetical protein